MDDVDLGQPQEGERLEHLPRELADQHQRHALELGAAQQVVEVEAHVLKDEARVAVVVEVLEEAHCREEGSGGGGGKEG